MDLDERMLERARTDWVARWLADKSDVAWVRADVSKWTIPASEHVSLVCICRSFHWMDQAAILQRYSEMTLPNSSVAVFADSSFWEAPTSWAIAARETIQSFLG